jgi:hypothetical protein
MALALRCRRLPSCVVSNTPLAQTQSGTEKLKRHVSTREVFCFVGVDVLLHGVNESRGRQLHNIVESVPWSCKFFEKTRRCPSIHRLKRSARRKRLEGMPCHRADALWLARLLRPTAAPTTRRPLPVFDRHLLPLRNRGRRQPTAPLPVEPNELERRKKRAQLQLQPQNRRQPDLLSRFMKRRARKIWSVIS